VFTTDSSKVGIYNLAALGSVGSFISTRQPFSVTITNQCPTSTITVVSIANQVYTSTSPALVFSFNDWTNSFSFCGSFTYSISVTVSGGGNSAFIQFNPLTRTFTVQSDLISNEDTYTITVTGTLPAGATSSVTFTLLVDKICN
jgi:hypothetical protein